MITAARKECDHEVSVHSFFHRAPMQSEVTSKESSSSRCFPLPKSPQPLYSTFPVCISPLSGVATKSESCMRSFRAASTGQGCPHNSMMMMAMMMMMFMITIMIHAALTRHTL